MGDIRTYSRTPAPLIDRDKPGDAAKATEITAWLRTCCSACDGGTADFVDSLARQWDKSRVFTERQYWALKRVHDAL